MNRSKALAKSLEQKHFSLLQLRWKRFCRLRRAYLSLWILVVTYVLSQFAPLYMNNKPYILSYQNKLYFPLFSSTFYTNKDLGIQDSLPAKYKQLKEYYQQTGQGWMLLPPIPYYFDETLTNTGDARDGVLKPPSAKHWLGTDANGRDVLVRLIYGYRLSMNYALLILFPSMLIGLILGGLFGYIRGKFDLFGQRLIEIWSAIPIFYILLILDATVLVYFFDKFILLVFFNVLFGWVGFTQAARGMFFRERNKDYVSAALSSNASTLRIIVLHILPNTLTPIITAIPFNIMGSIIGLSSLDYLGFGLKPPAPSWGEMMAQGKQFLAQSPHVFLSIFPVFVLILLLIVFVGEGLREAFDPRVHMRLH